MTNPSKGRGLQRGLGALGLGGPMPSAPEIKKKAPVASEAASTDEAGPSTNGATKPETLAEAESREARKNGLMMASITSIAPNPYQPRKHIDPVVLAELAQSIRENGLIQPPVVSYNPDYDPNYQETDEEESGLVKKERKARYLLIAGERRWQASKLAGLVQIPVVLKEATPIQMLELALVENIQRADLNPLEEAQAYKQLMQEFKLTQEAVAQRVGKSRAAVANSLRLFDLPSDILEAVYENFITEGHARALLMVHRPEDQHRLVRDIIEKQYSVRQTEEMARRLNAIAATANFPPSEVKPKLTPEERETRELEEHFREVLGVKVNLTRTNKGGKLVIQWDETGQLNEIYNKIVGPDGPGYRI